MTIRQVLPHLLAAVVAWAVVCGLPSQAAAEEKPDRPNVVLIYADDLGYGDVSCYGATAVKTPAIDRLADNGLRFTSGYAPSATCTPSRFAMLTGQYAWRRQGTGIARGDAALIIPVEQRTMADVFQSAGYKTGVVGKWHLGLGKPGMDWNGAIRPGPLELGFDYCFLIPATGDRVPCVYVENDRVVGLDPDDPIEVSFRRKIGMEPTGRENPELLSVRPSHGHDMTIVNGISRIGWMTGGQAARWDDETMAEDITAKAVAFINRHKDDPFFLFFSLHDIHVPRVPHPRFVGATDMGPRGDVIVQVDWCVAQITQALDDAGLLDNTLLIVTSDNGPVIDDGYQDQAVARLGDHNPSGPFRGGKYSKFEAGTRMPFIVHWPQRVKAGVSDAVVCQIDFPASFAALVGQELEQDDHPDSFNVLPALLGESEKGRDHLVQQGIGGLALRAGDWKFIPSSQGAAVNRNVNIELGNLPQPQLYNLADDPGERANLAEQHPDRVARLRAMLDKIRSDGRSRP